MLRRLDFRRLVLVALTILLAHAETGYGQAACTQIPGSQTCVDATPCKTMANGVQVCLDNASLPTGAQQVPYSCWQYTYQYACPGATTNTCGQYQSNPACGVLSSVCNDTIAETGECDEWTYTYQCQTQAQQVSSQMQCSNGLFDTSQFTAPANQNNSFVYAAVGLEALGEGQNYTNGQTLFSGVAESCRKGYGGIQNCCKSSPGAQSNSVIANIALGATMSVVKYVGEKAIDMASPYVFDFMYQAGLFGDGAFQIASTAASTGGTALAAGGLSVGAYGFTVGTGTMSAGVLGGNIELMSGADGYLAFNPYVFAAMVAIQIIENLMNCSQAEQLLALHRGENLSTFIDETCSKTALGSCIQHVDNFCSFNSLLSETINIQGKTQLGLPLADCKGLTPQQITKIDFRKIDFRAFEQQIVQQAQQYMPSSGDMSKNYQPVMQGAGKGSSQKSTNSVLPTYPSSSQ
ncbi:MULTISPECIES: conjugal transfer protein TraN [Paraburkholderia]|uniref:Conjugal transfer protein TraN n=1 Tax=Paraburkholderia madseniana TaxID=2599607 RepID=A0AAP5EZC1_9BURK|nr:MULTISPECIES: conjugal transfer protein TraN [Paraburkholderia]MCX4151021.1 conjugal transfer protein TraN [Paraburkholderia madseniana]MCX4176661.1 conjugal transfer protein TraN [Paraburkholderia madseniana]MDN7153953.1 conjugal transfer protein TraN [Paraburkholderia sp. WS6]MDQ6412835.1 conjugal transfer protein TraN [Paraburkholderia madseniana]MDQ6464652.1 conjugal transfer protein TraN [Paraburkholderia madseniana]